MMQPTFTKKLARRVMALAFIISPPNSREWTAAMSAELDHVEGSFTPLSWSIGCLGTALKQLCISILTPGAFGAETEGRMSKFAKISAVVLVAGSALFLLAPSFQQGLKLAALSWSQSETSWFDEMCNLGAEAEKNHDAQTLAFVAMQLTLDNSESVQIAGPYRAQRDKFADEAVQWDPQLTWIYYTLVSHDQYPPSLDSNDSRWLSELQKWDSNNAAVYDREASFFRPYCVTDAHPHLPVTSEEDHAVLANCPRWLGAMDKAFSASSYDSYLSRKIALDREVMLRHRLEDPSRLVESIMIYARPSDFWLYANDFLLKTGADFETKGDLRHAEEDYFKVEHLANLIQIRGNTELESGTAIYLQMMVGPHLQAVFQKSGNAPAAQLAAYQTALAQQTWSRFLSHPRWEFHRSEAWVVQLSLAGMAVAFLLICCSGTCLLVRRTFGRPRTGGLMFARTGLAGTALLFASAIAMYFSYGPYAAVLDAYSSGSTPRNAFESLARFSFLQELPSYLAIEVRSPGFKIDFWYTIIALGGAILVWILYRYISRTFSHSAPGQPAT